MYISWKELQSPVLPTWWQISENSSKISGEMEQLERLNWSVMWEDLPFLSIYPPVPAHQVTGNQRRRRENRRVRWRSWGCGRRPGLREGGRNLQPWIPLPTPALLPLLGTYEPSPAPKRPEHIHCAKECKCCVGPNCTGSDSDPLEHRCLRPCSETRADRCYHCSLNNFEKCCSTCDGAVGRGE